MPSPFERLQPDHSPDQTIHTRPSMVDIQAKVVELNTHTQKGNRQRIQTDASLTGWG